MRKFCRIELEQFSHADNRDEQLADNDAFDAADDSEPHAGENLRQGAQKRIFV